MFGDKAKPDKTVLASLWLSHKADLENAKTMYEQAEKALADIEGQLTDVLVEDEVVFVSPTTGVQIFKQTYNGWPTKKLRRVRIST